MDNNPVFFVRNNVEESPGDWIGGTTFSDALRVAKAVNRGPKDIYARKPCDKCGAYNVNPADNSDTCEDCKESETLKLLCCEWIRVPEVGEGTICNGCGSTFTRGGKA